VRSCDCETRREENTKEKEPTSVAPREQVVKRQTRSPGPGETEEKAARAQFIIRVSRRETTLARPESDRGRRGEAEEMDVSPFLEGESSLCGFKCARKSRRRSCLSSRAGGGR